MLLPLLLILAVGCVLGWGGLWLWYRHCVRTLAGTTASHWADLATARDEQRDAHRRLLDRHAQERAAWQTDYAAWHSHQQRTAEAMDAERAAWAAERATHLDRVRHLDERATTARSQRQAAISLLRKILNQRTLARGMPVEDTAEAFAFLVRTPDDELPQIHEQVFEKQTLRTLPHR